MAMFEKVMTFAISILMLGAFNTFGFGEFIVWDTVYVDQSRPDSGNGQSWSSAFNNLDTAICYNPDTNLVVLCAEGIYYPDSLKGKFERSCTKNCYFKLIGGFPKGCNENNLLPQDSYKVILSGDLDKNDSLKFDSTYVIKGNNANVILELSYYCNAWIERISFQCGNNISNYGGGLIINDTVHIVNCNFYSNKALMGGAIYRYDTRPARMFVDSCYFKDNTALDTIGCNGEHGDNLLGGGGAIHVQNAYLQITNCRFTKNTSYNSGGAVCIFNSPSLISINNKYKFCTAGSFGGAIYARINNVTIKNDSILDNTANRGGGALLSYNDNFNSDSAVFVNNHSGQHGGALILGSDGIINSCSFISNTADSSGGAMLVNSNKDYPGIVMENNRFENNTAAFCGGAMNVVSGPYFNITNNNIFKKNKAVKGGAIYADSESGGNYIINNALFDSDSAFNGGAIYSDRYMFVFYCMFKNNRADSSYGATKIEDATYKNSVFVNNSAGVNIIIGNRYHSSIVPVYISECTIADNYIPADGFIIYMVQEMKNSIVWNNNCHQIFDAYNCDYCLIKDYAYGGIGNISSDPKFVLDSSEHPYRLRAGSPAINMGDPDIYLLPQYDISGNNRLFGHRVDIGAYECDHGRFYVDSRAAGNNNGSNWGNAFKNLQDALTVAGAGDTVWVAKGTYKPDNGTNNRNLTFNIPSGVVLIGGFIGDETDISDRGKWTDNLVTLTGEINNQISASDNSYNVVTVSSNCVIDGFRIVRGNNTGCKIENSSNSKIRNCIISSNNILSGAPLKITDCNNITVENCYFSSNIVTSSTSGSAAGILSNNCLNLILRNNVFTGNNPTKNNNASTAFFSQCSLKITNCTFSRNNNKTLVFDTCTVNMLNSIVWNETVGTDTLVSLKNADLSINYCDISNGISAIKADANSTINDGGIIYNLNPDFIKASENDVSLTRTSPCIDRGLNVDTSGWGYDLVGNRRIQKGVIDIGALEFPGDVQPEAPIILSTLNNFSIPANGTLKINLNRKKSDSTGYYVLYSFRDIDELTWQCVTTDTGLTTTIDPDSNILTIKMLQVYRPGDRFILRLRAADPEYTKASAEKSVQFTVINPGFEICESKIVQNDTGRDFNGYISVANTIDPVFLSKTRIYLGDNVNGEVKDLQFIEGITLDETDKPESRGGTDRCGTYKFSFNATSVTVYNKNGNSTGKTLYQWATEMGQRWVRY